MLVTELIKLGDNPNVIDINGGTPIHYLMGSNSPVDFISALIPILVQPGADLNTKGQRGRTILHVLMNRTWRGVTVGQGSTLVTELIQLGADASVVDDDGNTPLHCLMHCMVRDNVDLVLAMITLLVQAGGDLNAENLKNG